MTPRSRRRPSEADRINTAFRIGAVRHRLTWFKPPAPPAPVGLTTGRVSKLEVNHVDLTPYARQASLYGVNSYAGAKERAHAFAAQAETAADWAARELHRPKATGDMYTVRFAGKPYHWRQDYTGQLKLAPGESPW